MKKSFRPQWLILTLTVLAAAAGTAIRFVQLNRELSLEGQLAPGATRHIALIALTVVLVGGLIGLLLSLRPRKLASSVFSSHPLPACLQLLSAAALLVGNGILWLRGPQKVVFMMTQSPKLSAFLEKLLPPLGVLCALCIAIFAVQALLKKQPSAALYMVAGVYLILRLILWFQAWNSDPSIHDYCFRLLAAICTMLGAIQLAAFAFDKGKRRMTLFWCLCAVVFSVMSLPDAFLRGTLDEAVLLAALTVFMAVSAVQLLFCREEEEQAASPDAAPEANPDAAPDAASEPAE